MISYNPVANTKKYPRRKPKIQILNKEQIILLLHAAKGRNWFLEIILALYLGLRKGEILGLKFGDFDLSEKTEPKTEKSNRILRFPNIVLVELEKRRRQIEANKNLLEDAYHDMDYVSCQKNGLPHGLGSMNKELYVLCERNLLPHITVHGLRHMFATILLERGVSIAKISGMLGHSSIHTTFEFYLDIMDADENYGVYE